MDGIAIGLDIVNEIGVHETRRVDEMEVRLEEDLEARLRLRRRDGEEAALGARSL